MNQILFVSNKKIYKELYQINTSIYLNADLLYLTSKNAAQLNAEQLNLVKIIIFDCDQNEILQELSVKILNNRKDKLPLICFNDGIDIPGAFTLHKLEDPLNLKEVLKSCALAFGVTAQDMSNLNVPDYFPVIRKVFKYLKESPVKIYIKDESNQFKQLWDVNQEISGEQYFQYAATKSFYVLKNDRLKLANAVNPKLIEFAKQRTCN